MEYRKAQQDDVPLLAELNQQLIKDEGHKNLMSLAQLEKRMLSWIKGEYIAMLFTEDHKILAYALYRDTPEEVHLRQFFVLGKFRRRGLGRHCVKLLRTEIWPSDKRITVDVLCNNEAGLFFWRAVGFNDYCLTLEINPPLL